MCVPLAVKLRILRFCYSVYLCQYPGKCSRYIDQTTGWTSTCFPLPVGQKSSWTHTASYSMVTRARSPRVKRPGREVRAFILLLLYAYVAGTGTNLLLALFICVSQDSLKNTDYFPVQHFLLALSNENGLLLSFVSNELNVMHIFNTGNVGESEVYFSRSRRHRNKN